MMVFCKTWFPKLLKNILTYAKLKYQHASYNYKVTMIGNEYYDLRPTIKDQH